MTKSTLRVKRINPHVNRRKTGCLFARFVQYSMKGTINNQNLSMVARFSFMLDFTSRLTFGMIVLEMGNHAVYTSFKNFLSHTLKVFGCFFLMVTSVMFLTLVIKCMGRHSRQAGRLGSSTNQPSLLCQEWIDTVMR